MTTRTVPFLAAAVLLAASTTASFAASPPPGANAKKCGSIATANGGKANYIRASKVSCTQAKAVAKRAKGKAYKTSGFSCQPYSAGLFLCSKSAGKGSVVFQYKKPSR